jgi:FlaA1/EpsC-like NDP-sugar epimerase
MEQLTEQEIISMYGSTYQFFSRMNVLFRDLKLHAAYHFSNEKLQSIEVDTCVFDEIKELKRYLNHMSNDRADRICIFGAGAYGKRLKELLQDRIITVDNFCDNNPEKWGTFIEGVMCVSPTQLMEMNGRTLVIVAVATPEPIVRQLNSLGFLFVTTKQELDPMLDKTTGLKWVTALDGMEGVDYTANGVKVLMNQFKKVIVEMGNRMMGSI